jgi:hypothetical protein
MGMGMDMEECTRQLEVALYIPQDQEQKAVYLLRLSIARIRYVDKGMLFFA